LGDTIQTTVQISRENKKHMTLDEIRKLFIGMEERASKNGDVVRILVRGMDPYMGGHTLKGFKEDFMSDEEFEDYWGNNVKQANKFNDFFNATITIWKLKKVEKK